MINSKKYLTRKRVDTNMWWIIFIVYASVFGFSTSYVAREKGKNENYWFLIGVLLGIIGLLMIGFSKDSETNGKLSNRSYNKYIFYKNKTHNLTTDYNSPVEVVWNSIHLVNERIILCSNIKNVSTKNIDSLIYRIECLNNFQKPVNKADNIIEKTLQDLNLLPQQFIEKQSLTDLSLFPSTRKVNIWITKVLFSDGEIWEAKPCDLVEVETCEINKIEYLNQLKESEGQDVIGLFMEKKDRWICICGRNNLIRIDTCLRCKRNKNVLKPLYNKADISNTLKLNNKNIKEKNVKILRVIIWSIFLLIILSTLYYINQVTIPKKNKEKEQALIIETEKLSEKYINEEKYDELLNEYKKVITVNGMNKNFRNGVLELLDQYLSIKEYNKAQNVLDFLIKEDGKYKPTYKLVLNELNIQKYDLVNELLREIREGNLESGQVFINKDLIVGLDLSDTNLDDFLGENKQKVKAQKLLEYRKGQLIDRNIYMFKGDYYSGPKIGWVSNNYMYQGPIVDGSLEGNGTLYVLYDINKYIIHYKGSFKEGLYDGEGIIYWSSPTNIDPEPLFTKFTESFEVSETVQPLLKAEFENGVIEGNYQRYYSDGSKNDSGSVYNRVVRSSKYKYREKVLGDNIEIPDSIHLFK